MEPIIINKTDDTPEVNFNAANGEFSITGISLPEDSKEFYAPLIEYVEEYFENPKDQSLFSFQMTYFNTSSSKMIFEMLHKIQSKLKEGCKVDVYWFYQEDDEEMMEAGEELADIFDMPIIVKEFEYAY